jgi:dipeptidyl aminopeptidase/acylaminoacyl peptidase
VKLNVQRAPYGTWSSVFSADLITSEVVVYGGLSSTLNRLFWLETRPSEGGRSVLVSRAETEGAEVIELTPAPYNVRTRVHEYGGGAYLATDDWVYFVNFTDQDLYRLHLGGGAIERVTETGPTERYADFALDAERQRLLCVCERHRSEDVENSIAAVDVVSGAVAHLVQGHDFYASPRVSPDTKRLCFLAWNHPNMPWDGTELFTARLDATLSEITLVAGGVAESIVQPEWLSNDRLGYVSDIDGWWNLYSFDSSGIYCIHPDTAEFAQPAWGLAMRGYAPLGPKHLACRRIEDGNSELSILDMDNGMLAPVTSAWTEFDAMTANRGQLSFIGGRADRLSAVVRVDLTSGEETVLAGGGNLGVDAERFANPSAIIFPTRDGNSAHALYYPPTNLEFDAPAHDRPPVLVTTHGGPTAAADTRVNLRAQYYASRGWAVVDVNYRGSSGFGRAYRDRLKGNWGELDVSDCEDVVTHLRNRGAIDPNRVAIRGGSAGGFTTLAALTTSDLFTAGASHYGIGDLEALARDTHKFESRYIDGLIGPYPEASATYQARSPVHHVDRLNCPVVFFQGLEDPIVPPNQAEAMVAALDAKGLPVAYVAFAGEHHGFRVAENIRRAIEAEYLFFSRVFGFEPADIIPPLDINNL